MIKRKKLLGRWVWYVGGVGFPTKKEARDWIRDNEMIPALEWQRKENV